MAQWFRMYAEVLDDPKVQRLRPEMFRMWVNMLCLAAKNDGELPSVEDIAFALRLSEKAVNDGMNILIMAGLIDVDSERTSPHNWNGRQYQSDVSSERVKRFRKRQRNGACNVSETADETPPEQSRTDTETETEKKEAAQGMRVPSLNDLVCDDELREWAFKNTPGLDPAAYVENVKLYCQSKGKRYKDYRAAVKVWMRKDFANQRASPDRGTLLKSQQAEIDRIFAGAQ